MYQSKFSVKGLAAATVAAGAALVFASSAMAAVQVFDFAEASSVAPISSKTVTASTAFTFDVVYKGSGNESGLGLKLRYDKTKYSAISIVSGQTLTSCNIGGTTGSTGTAPDITTDGIQRQETGTFGTYSGQFVAGWIYTAVDAAGAVFWPNGPAAAPATNCLVNNTATGAAGSDVKLFRVSATPIAGFTGSTTMQLTADGNFSYATGSTAPADKTLTLNAGGGGGLTLAASNPIVSRKTHGAAGVFDIPITSGIPITDAGITIESRSIGSGHQIVYTFTTAPAAAGTATVTNAGGTSVGSATTAISGNSVIVTLTGVADNQRVNVNVSNVGGAGVFSNTVPVGFLLGDVDSSRQVGPTDINLTKAAANAGVVNSTTFRRDLNADGSIGPTDINLVKARASASTGPL
jgi:hypothetical protein